MDINKLKQWLEFAQKIQGGGSNFWNSVFEDEYAREFLKKQTESFHPFSNQGFPGNQSGMGEHVGSETASSGENQFWGAPDQGVEKQNSSTGQRNDYPLIDIYTQGSQLIIVFELPGVRKEDIHLSVSSNTVILRGQVHPPFDNTSAQHAERFYGSFERKIPLPLPFNEKNISAKFVNGLLFASFQIEKQYEEQIVID